MTLSKMLTSWLKEIVKPTTSFHLQKSSLLFYSSHTKDFPTTTTNCVDLTKENDQLKEKVKEYENLYHISLKEIARLQKEIEIEKSANEELRRQRKLLNQRQVIKDALFATNLWNDYRLDTANWHEKIRDEETRLNIRKILRTANDVAHPEMETDDDFRS